MVTRKATLLANTRKTGSGGTNFRATLPTSWIREMGLDEDNRNLILKFEGDSIVIKKDNIFLVETEDGNIIYDMEESEIQARDQVVYESDIESLVNIEMAQNTHEDDIEDYDTELEFYLSNAKRSDFTSCWLHVHLEHLRLSEDARVIIQWEVISRIKDRLK